MKVINYAASAALLAVGLSGCATVTRGTTTEFSVSSTPPGASVKTSTGFQCDATPCSMKVPRKTPFDVTVAKTGFVTKTLHVRSEVGGGGAAGLAGNVVAGGFLGMAIDASSGAMNDLTPNPMTVSLDAVPAAPAAPDKDEAKPAAAAGPAPPASPALASPAPASPAPASATPTSPPAATVAAAQPPTPKP
jgi:hypothetical protein